MRVLVILALALGAYADRAAMKPTVKVNMGHSEVGSGVNMDKLKGDIRVSSDINDDVNVGVEYNHGSDNPIRAVLAKVSQRFNGADVHGDLEFSTNDNSISGDVSYRSGDNEVVARVNSADSNVVESVEVTRKQAVNGLNFLFRPKYNVADKNLEIETSADLDENTNLLVKVSQQGNADFEVDHRLDSDTRVHFAAKPSDNSGSVEVSRRLDDDNTIKPKFDISSKHLSCSWVRKLKEGRQATLNVDPDNSIELDFEGRDDNDWNVNVKTPWGDMKNADVSVNRQFEF